eukprot:TRINITY_DN43593_c0_g1_i1.p1 TRINITY_DN43593_c0_g1~~TRINITY_DN43593_c0_g1_i1.p1  ORF type:complete len:221 (-),score=29.57 TRINITY_DN43593_c0_g1_i1:125-787(-)
MGQCESAEQLPATKPVLYYMPLAGRGEISAMCCKLGGLEMEYKVVMATDIDVKSFGSPGSLPVFEHGDLKLSQSNAILAYIYKIVPKLKALSAAHTARDRQFISIMDDIMDGCMPKIFAKDPNMKENTKSVLEKFFPLLEAMAPSVGFVNGLEYPTGADFVLVILAKGYMPYQVLNKIAGIDPWATCPKLKGVLERTLAVPEVKAYVENSATMAGNPFGM